MNDLDLSVFDELPTDTAFELLLKFLEEVSIEVSNQLDVTLETGLKQAEEYLKVAHARKVAIKDKLFELWRKGR